MIELKSKRLTPKTLTWIGASVFGVIALSHFFVIVRNAVDIPYWDEWRYFEADALSEKLNWGWVFHQHNEHRIILPHLFVWLLYRVNRLDLVAQLAINFIVYLIIPLLYLWIARLQLNERAWIIWPFLWLLLTPLDWENHSWGFQTPWHFNLIFMTLGAILLFHPRPSALKAALGAVSLVLEIASLSGGVVPAVLIALAYAVHRTRQMRRTGWARRDVAEALGVLVVVVGVTAWWFAEFEKPSNHPPFTWPTDDMFWVHYLNGLSLAFGNGRYPIEGSVNLVLLGTAYLLAWIVPLSWQTWRQESPPRDTTLPMRVVLVGATLAGFAMVSFGRAPFGVQSALSSRYYEMVLPLVPLMALSWAAVPPRWMRSLVLVGLWVLIVRVDAPNWRDTRYRAHREDMLQADACIRAYYLRQGPAKCPTANPDDIAPLLERAKELGVTFARNMKRS